jgi:hypothetical protein
MVERVTSNTTLLLRAHLQRNFWVTTESSRRSHIGDVKYEIRIVDSLDTGWASWFDGMQITNEPDNVTVIAGEVVDQAELHGLLAKVRDLGVTLLSVRCPDA